MSALLDWWIAAPVAVLLAAAVYFVVVRLLDRRWPDERTEECTCGKVLPISKMHIVGTSFGPDGEFGNDGGSFVTATFCPEHCPGGCNKERAHVGA